MCPAQDPASSKNPAKKLTIVATIGQIGEPIAYITDGRATVETLMGEGVDPHLYRPTRATSSRLMMLSVISGGVSV